MNIILENTKMRSMVIPNKEEIMVIAQSSRVHIVKRWNIESEAMENCMWNDDLIIVPQQVYA